MSKRDKPAEIELVSCEICLKEIPVSEATVPEATDYFVHFCGLECYEKWKRQERGTVEKGKNPTR
jgi:hypothetical protein